MSKTRSPLVWRSSVTAPSNDLNGYWTGFGAPSRGWPWLPSPFMSAP
jgi:hypothetical protein